MVVVLAVPGQQTTGHLGGDPGTVAQPVKEGRQPLSRKVMRQIEVDVVTIHLSPR